MRSKPYHDKFPRDKFFYLSCHSPPTITACGKPADRPLKGPSQKSQQRDWTRVQNSGADSKAKGWLPANHPRRKVSLAPIKRDDGGAS